MVSRYAWGRGTSPAGAAFGKLSFNNQAGSNILVKVLKCIVSYPIGGIIGITIEGASAGGTQINFTKEYMDGRLSTLGLDPIVDIRFDNSGGLSGHPSRIFFPANTPITIDYESLILGPGARFHMEAIDAAQEFSATLQWIETNLR